MWAAEVGSLRDYPQYPQAPVYACSVTPQPCLGALHSYLRNGQIDGRHADLYTSAPFVRAR